MDGERPEENRYYTNVGDMDDAESVAGQLILLEKTIFSTAIQFTAIKLWEVGATPRKHRSVPLSGTGSYTGTDPLAPEIVLRVFFGTNDSNPYYKDYRTRVSSTAIVGPLWGATYLATVSTFAEDLDELVGQLPITTKAGVPLGDVGVETRYRFRQLHPRWYNRTS